MQDRFERLAGRGTRRGADEVLRAAQRSVPSESEVDQPDAGGPDLEVIDDLPIVTAEPTRSRGRFATLIAATGVVALLGVGMLAVTAMFGSGGADSPEAAVRQLADAVSHKDPLAAVDVLEPTEVRSMRDTVSHITKRAADLKIVDNASQPLAGVDLSVDHLQVSATNVGDGFAKVTITSGTLSAGTYRAAMSKLLQNATRGGSDVGEDAQGKADLARLASDSDLPTFVMTVRHSGRWYVSPMYTAFEYAREAADGPPADFGSAQAAQLGADSPELAVSDALHAWQAGNWDRLIALAPPDELPVYDYRAWIDQEVADQHPDFTIDALTTSADVSGDRAVVKLEASGTMGSDGDQSRWQVGGTCPTPGDWFGYAPLDSTDRTSTNTGPELCLAGGLGQAIPFGLLAVQSTPATSASGAVSIEVVREDGRWFVSPVSTVLDAVDNFVEHVDERTLYPFIGLGYLLPPDATVALNQPMPAGPSDYGRVYAFDGTAGQEVVGQAEGDTRRYYYVTGQLYTADGRDVGFIDFQPKSDSGCCANRVRLPTTGSYRLVVLEGLPADVTLTLFDTDHAPKSLLDNGDYGGGGLATPGEHCTYTNDTVSCTGVAGSTLPLPNPTVRVTPTTAVGTSRSASVATTTSP